MTDEATTDSSALEAIHCKAQATYAEEHAKYADNLARIIDGDEVTKKLVTEIVERLGMISRQVDIPYTVFFPLHFNDVMLTSLWHTEAVRITEFIEGGGAKEALFKYYFELEEAQAKNAKEAEDEE